MDELLILKCAVDSSDELRLDDNGDDRLCVTVHEACYDKQRIVLNVDTAIELRDALSRWIGDQK